MLRQTRASTNAQQAKDHELPRDWHAEREVLGALIADPTLLARARQHELTERVFDLERHRHIFRALSALAPDDHALGGLPALVDALRRSGDLGAVGGPEQVADVLCNGLHSASNVLWLVRNRLLPLHRARAAVRACEGAARRIRECPHEAPSVVAALLASLAAHEAPDA